MCWADGVGIEVEGTVEILWLSWKEGGKWRSGDS